MTFADLQRGEAIFVDANTLIYHFTNHRKYGAASALVERIELKEIPGFTSSQCLADVAHRVMTRFPISGLINRRPQRSRSLAFRFFRSVAPSYWTPQTSVNNSSY